MFFLAIETSGHLGSIALGEDGSVVGEQVFEHGLQHAAEMLPMIDQMTREKGIGPGKIEQVYVS
ncbi:MAG TPA: hypothetical protein VG722_05555, partial [Tepidisphaeraceae bacterium]|nr:hypothetical protein [Tepidisphaeraceae bacterium]